MKAYLLKLSNIDEDGTKLKFILQKNVEKRIGKFDYNHNFQLASYLDPRFKHICIPDTELLSLKQRIVSGLKQQEPEEIPDIELTSVEPTASCSTASTITLYSADPDVESCCTDRLDTKLRGFGIYLTAKYKNKKVNLSARI